MEFYIKKTDDSLEIGPFKELPALNITNKALQITADLTIGTHYDNQKRLLRYAKKCKDMVLNQYLKVAFPDAFKKRKFADEMMAYMWPDLYTVNDFLREMLKIFLLNWTTDRNKVCNFAPYVNEENIVFAMTPKNASGCFLLGMNQDAIDRIGDILLNNVEFFNTIADDDFVFVCQEYLAARRAAEDNVTEANKYMFYPSTVNELCSIFLNTYSRVYYDLMYLGSQSVVNTLSDMAKGIKESLQNTTVQDLETKSSTLEENNQTLQDKVRRLEIENKRLADKLDMIDDANAEYTSLLERKLNKLRKKHESLAENVSVQQTEAKDTTIVAEPNIDVDINKTYLFVCGEGHPNKAQILEAFPNSIIYDGQKLTSLKYDMVVLLISHLDHATYYKVKQHCQAQKDTYIQCSLTNIDGIKDTIWNVINN